MKKKILSLLLIFSLGITATSKEIGQIVGRKDKNTYKKEVKYIKTENTTNTNLKFMYYIPAKFKNSNSNFPVIVFVPGLDGDGETSLPIELYELADNHGFGILAPSFKFNQEDFDKRQSYQYPQAWSGNALIKMLNKAKRSGLNYSKLYLMGFSAGAQFSSRFSLMRPDMVDACAILGSGARLRPKEKNNVEYFVGIGTLDSVYRQENAKIFTDTAKELGISVTYRQYPIDHSTSEDEIKDVINFFIKVKQGKV